MSINFGQFPTPRLPVVAADVVVGYQLVGSVPTLAQYTMLQLAGVIGPIIGGLPPTGPAGGDLSGTYPNPTVSAVHAASGTLNGIAITGGTVSGAAITTGSINNTPIGNTTPSTGVFTTAVAGSVFANGGAIPAVTSSGVQIYNASTANVQLIDSIRSANNKNAFVSWGATTLAMGFANDAFTTFANFFTATGGQAAGISGLTSSSGTGAWAHTGAMSVTGTLTPSQTNGIVGTTTNNNANAGSVGEFISSTVLQGSAVPLTTNVTANVTSISLTAGDWDVWGNVATVAGGATTVQNIQGAIATTSATLPTSPNGGAYFLSTIPEPAGGANNTWPTGTIRLSLAATTTVFLVVNAGFLASTYAAYGFIGARRRR